MLEPLLLTSARVLTYDRQLQLTNASSFFFERDERLFLVTSRHVVVDQPSNHFPDRIEIELHVDPGNLARSTGFSIPLYRDGKSIWRQGLDNAGEIDVAVIEIERAALPKTTVYRAFSPRSLLGFHGQPEVGSNLLVVGYPLGFHDTLHHMPVARHAVIASSFGLRFQGQGYFLTDARTHRGTSRRAGGDARPRAGPDARRPAVDRPRHPLVAARRRHPRPDARRGPRSQLRLVRRHPDDPHRKLTAGVGRHFNFSTVYPRDK